MTTPVPNMVWLDLETTGLHEQTDNVLEVGVILTRPEPTLEIIAVENWIFTFDVSRTPPPKIDERVLEMHRVNGLWTDCRNSKRGADHEGRRAIWKEVEAFIAKNGGQGSWLWGSGVGFERAWLRHSAPEVLSLFHYRNGDVNTLFGLQGIIFDGDPNGQKAQPNDQTHRALDDLERDIGIAREWLGLLPQLMELQEKEIKQ